MNLLRTGEGSSDPSQHQQHPRVLWLVFLWQPAVIMGWKSLAKESPHPLPLFICTCMQWWKKKKPIINMISMKMLDFPKYKRVAKSKKYFYTFHLCIDVDIFSHPSAIFQFHHHNTAFSSQHSQSNVAEQTWGAPCVTFSFLLWLSKLHVRGWVNL